MGQKFDQWIQRSPTVPSNIPDVRELVFQNRSFEDIAGLEYGDHGLLAALEQIKKSIEQGDRIALYADYDVDGTMSCVSWVWFFEAVGFKNYTYYIPDRFTEGYGLNLNAIKHLIEDEGAQLIITMDTGITANAEASYCKEQGVAFICTDHHVIQPDKMPDCIILNPKLHPDPIYQELCGCGVTFVLLRKLGQEFEVDPAIWTDLLALTGMATICDVVPLNPVNHRLARMGVRALSRSQRPILSKLLTACKTDDGVNEQDVGFRLGPRINAVGRLDHAKSVVKAFIDEDPDELITYMGQCNERRRTMQQRIVEEALEQAMDFSDDPILFLGGDWHQGVVGIAASKIAETYWKPTWLFSNSGDQCKGSARSIPGFDVTAAMQGCAALFAKFGGHKAAGGYSFDAKNEAEIRKALIAYAAEQKAKDPSVWRSKLSFDCELPSELIELQLTSELDELRPFGMAFEEPSFQIKAKLTDKRFYKDKATGKDKHTALFIARPHGPSIKLMFFNEVITDLNTGDEGMFIVTVARNTFRGRTEVNLMGQDWDVVRSLS